jgi:hypothetical protein
MFWALRGKQMTNFESTLLQANDFEKRAGFFWYLDSHNYIKEMSVSLNVKFDLACGIVAVLSPMLAWSENLNLAHQLIKFNGKLPASVKSSAFPLNIEKARKMLKAKRVFPYLRGVKVVEFYHNILNPLDPDHVTIDTFMLACHYNKNEGLGRYFTEKHIGPLKQIIRGLGIKYSLLPCQVQATIWLTYHRIVKSTASYSGQLNLKIF